MELQNSVGISASGLKAQSLRMRIIAENLANSDSVAATPGGTPYRRRIATFKAEMDAAGGGAQVTVTGIQGDKSAFPRAYQPGNPAADANGYVLLPNVNSLTEGADMKAAQRSYEANLDAIEAARTMTMRTIDLLK